MINKGPYNRISVLAIRLATFHYIINNKTWLNYVSLIFELSNINIAKNP